MSANRTMQLAAAATEAAIEALLGLPLPDMPRWVEAHGLCGEADSWVRRWRGGALVGNDRACLAVVVGETGEESALNGALAAWREVVAERPKLTLLCADAAAALQLAAAAPGHRAHPAKLHTLAEPLEPLPLEVALLSSQDALAHVPQPLRDELTTALAATSPAGHAGRVWAVWVEGAPVAFAFASWRSPRWFDVSVETLPGFRQLGLGEMVARALILDEAAQGRAPVWGALHDNHASLRLAARLGFVACDELWVVAP